MSLLNYLSNLCAPFKLLVLSVGQFGLKPKLRGGEILKQCYEGAVLSAPMVLFSISIVSLMGVLEFSWHMMRVMHEDALVPAFSLVLTIRELAPVVTAMLLASRLGAAIAAEIGIMKNSEQLDQLQLLGVSLVDFLILPRWIGCLLASLSLTLLGIVVAVLVSSQLASYGLGYQAQEFYNALFVLARGRDLAGALVKAVLFGTTIPFVAAASGLACKSGSRGIGQAATQAVVKSSLWIIILDFLVNSLLWIS